MVEHRPLSDFIAYAILTLGVFIVAFPVYLALIASTHDAATVVGGHMPAMPGSRTLENYYRAFFVGRSRTSRRPVANMLINSFVSAIGIAVGSDRLQRAIDQPGQRLHRLLVVAHQHERIVVAQRGEIAVSGENRRMQIAAGKRGELTLRQPAGEMKRDVRLKFCLHAEIASFQFKLAVSSRARLNFACPRPAAIS